MEKHCPACGMAQSGDRARCYNCNASLEREPVVAPKPAEAGPRPRKTQLFYSEGLDPSKPGATTGEGSPEASGPRPKVVVPEVMPEAGSPSSGPGEGTAFGRAIPKRDPTGLTPPDGSPTKRDLPAGLTPSEGTRLVRGTSTADPTQFRPPTSALRTRGSSGDPSEIAPPTNKIKRPVDPASEVTPSSRPRPAHAGAPADEPPVFGSSLRKPGEAATASPGPPPLEPKRTLPSDHQQRPRPVIPDAVAQAVQAANTAARSREKLDPQNVAAAANELAHFDVAEPPSAVIPAASPLPPGEAPPTRPIPRRTGPVPAGGMPHYLTTQVLGEPVALSRSQPTRIGRGEQNEIIFPLGQVSRAHAEVRWDPAADAFVVVDMNSANGTFVNEKPVKRRRLAEGDRIGIGPFTLHYRTTTGTPPAAPDETETIKTGALAGDLAEIPLADVARFVESLRKTGELALLSSTGERGCVIFREGQPVHAEWKMALGVQAAHAFFRTKAGTFRFSAKPIEVQKASITTSLAQLLEDASK